MLNSIRSPKINAELISRQKKLQTKLRLITSSQFVLVKMDQGYSSDGQPRLIFDSHIIRVKKTNYYFHIWEEFRDYDSTPELYGFKYCLLPQPLKDSEPLFRYECHPDVDDIYTVDGEEVASLPENYSNYGVTPHFHPYAQLEYPLSRLHYPFHRSERAIVVFSLIQWIEQDMVKRFFETGRVK